MPELPDRDVFEGALARRLGRTGSTLARQIIALIPEDFTPNTIFTLPQETLDLIAQSYTEALLPELETIFLAGAEAQEAAIGLSVDIDVVNQRAADWARQYTFDLVRGITDNSRTTLQNAVNDYFAQRTTLRDLNARISRTFGPVRATSIAITETTRAAAQGELLVQRELHNMGVRTALVWQTVNDGHVCVLCSPLDGTRQGDGWNDLPPRHVGCRCFTNAEVVLSET